MKKFNLAALPLAVAGVLASTSAFAGTEACFEVYRGAVDSVVTNHAVLYTPASCEAVRTGADEDGLAANDAATVAWELTGDIDLDLDDIDGAGALAAPTSHVVYIPTTDIPPASRIKMQLTGADFGTGNANQLYLVHEDAGADGNPATLADNMYQTVASSDGAFDSTDTVEFLTKAGVTIGAGSRLLISNTNPTGIIQDGALLTGVQIHVDNSETCSITPEVTIRAISAFTDAGTVIAGASSSSTGAESILDISEQFSIVAANLVNPNGPNAAQEILVDAEVPSYRKSFVNNAQNGGSWDNQVTAQTAFWEAEFTNKFDTLDLYVTLAATDTVTANLSTDSGTGAGITFSILTAENAADFADASILDATQADHLSVATAGISLVDFNGVAVDDVPLTTTPVSYVAFADEYFSESAGNVSVVNAATRLTNDPTEVMEFNYNVETSWSMDFTDANYLDKNGCQTPSPFAVGVNGAVLKVPYTYTKMDGGFVRVTSEHDTVASIFMDIFDESSNEYKNVELGLIQPKSSNVFKTDFLLGEAQAAGYVGTGARHTMTFTVTAPKNKVHGVSVQTIQGGVDRVMPVLDQNDWAQ